LVPWYHSESVPDRTPLPVCNFDYSSSAPHAEADIPLGNWHTCDIHFATLAFSVSKKKRPWKGPELIDLGWIG
jgi:hypothetical protein